MIRPSFSGVAPLLAILLAGSIRSAHSNEFEVATVDGKPIRAAIAGLTTKWDLQFAPPAPALSAQDWIGFRRANAVLPPPPSDPHLVLTSGDRFLVASTSLALVGDHLSFSCPWLSDGKATRLSLSSISLIWRSAPEGIDDAEAYKRRLLALNRRRDAIVLRNGDVLEGVLVRLDGRGLELKVERGTVKVEMAQLSAVVLSSALATSARPKELHGKLVLVDGSRFTLRSASCADRRTLQGATLEGATVSVPLAQVAALDLMQGRAVYLSDVEQVGYKHTPFLGVSWPLRVDESVTGRELRLGGSVYDRGLGMHSDSRVWYRLPAGTRRFEAVVGLDDVSGRKGHVRIRVLVDGKDRALPSDGARTFKDGPLVIGMDVSGARELTLLVEYGAGGDVGDHVNWANARLIR